MKRMIRKVGRSLSRDRFGQRKNSGSKESLDSTLTHQSNGSRGPTRPPRPDSKMSSGSNDPAGFPIGRLSRSSSFSTINSIGTFERSKTRSSLRDGSLTRIKNFFSKQRDSDNDSVRSAKSGKSSKSVRSINERGRSTENTRRSMQKFSGQKYLVKVELSIRRAGTRPVFTQRTEIVMDNNPETKNHPKPYFPMKLNDCHLDENGAFMLRAEVLGYPIPHVQFFKDKSNEPLISQAQLHHTAKHPVGFYELVAENCHGVATCKANVMPPKPETVAINAVKNSSEEPIGLPPPGLPPTGRPNQGPDLTTKLLNSQLEEKSGSSNSSLKDRRSSQSSIEYVRPSVGLTATGWAHRRRDSMQSQESRDSQDNIVASMQHKSAANMSAEALADVRNSIRAKEEQRAARRLAPNFGASFDEGDGDIVEFQRNIPEPLPQTRFEAIQPLRPAAPTVPSHTGAPTAYRSSRAASPSDSEYYSGGYESCMETPTGSPRASPTPGQMPVPSESDAYLSANDVFSKTNYGVTSEEEYMTAGGSDTEVGDAFDDRTFTKAPSVIFFNHSPLKLRALQPLCLTCEVDGVPEPEVKWFRDGLLLHDGHDGYQLKRVNRGKWSLFLSQTSKDNEGNYAITVTNALGSTLATCRVSVDSSFSLPAMPDLVSSCDEMSSQPGADRLFIYDTDSDVREIPNDWSAPFINKPPEIMKRLRNQSVKEGALIHLEVEVQLNGGKGCFYKNGVLVSNTERTKVLAANSSWVLRISSAKTSDCGEYTFEAFNGQGKVESKCLINIERKKKLGTLPVFEEIMEDCQIPIGGNALFSVQVKGTPPPKIEWKLNNRRISNADKGVDIQELDDGVHQISFKNWAAQGTITCIASNVSGEAECKADLALEKSNLEKNYSIVKEEYRVHSGVSARGSYSVIRRASERKTGKEVAIKTVSRENIDKAGIRREIIVLQRLNSDRLVKILKSYHTVQSIIVVSEWLAGGSLFQKLIDAESYSETTIMFYFTQLLEAVQYLHENEIAHLDIRPKACLLDASRKKLKLGSFGNAREIQEDILEPLDRCLPEFASPEVAHCVPVSFSSDIFSLGTVLYSCLTGLSPFLAANDKE